MKRSAQSEQSKMSILVNELNRRFEVIDDNVDIDEKVKIVDHFTSQLAKSGYNNKQAKEVVMSSLKGIKKKAEKRLKSDRRFKSGADTLEERCKKKLMEATSWYKDRKKENDGEEEEDEPPRSNLNNWKRYRERVRKKSL